MINERDTDRKRKRDDKTKKKKGKHQKKKKRKETVQEQKRTEYWKLLPILISMLILIHIKYITLIIHILGKKY